MAEMGSQFVCLAHFSALQAKQHSQSMPKARQRGPEARQCTVARRIWLGSIQILRHQYKTMHYSRTIAFTTICYTYSMQCQDHLCNFNIAVDCSTAQNKYHSINWPFENRQILTQTHPYLIIGWEDEVLGPGGIRGRVQGVGSDHWGTSSQP